MVTINIGRKEMVFFGVVVLVFVVAGLAIAYGGTNPAVMGHSANEIARCGANQVLKMDSAGTSWTCANLTQVTSGRVIGGGAEYWEFASPGFVNNKYKSCAYAWGQGYCHHPDLNEVFDCKTGSTKVMVSQIYSGNANLEGEDSFVPKSGAYYRLQFFLCISD